ncbi:MAG: DsbA family protein [Rhodospirillales bacterium]|nr:DsbA family protein [Rhodospirillales bacterium]
MRFLLFLLLGLLLAPAVRAADPHDGTFTPAQRAEIVAIVRQALIADPTILRDAVTALQESETAHHEAAARSAIAAAGPALTAAPGDPVVGNPKGDVTVVEFYDLHCPYCRRMVPVIDSLLRQDPKIRLVYKDIPILGPGSVLGARAVLAAQRQDGYARLQSALMRGSPQITEDSLRTAVKQAGLDWERLQRDMQDPAIAARIQTNLDLAHKLGVDGTPAFVIGNELLPGAMELADLQDAVKAARAATAASR